MLKKILRTALVAAGVVALTPFAGAQGFAIYGRPMVTARLGGYVVTPGAFSVINPSAGYVRSMQFVSPQVAPIRGRLPVNRGFVQPFPSDGTVIPLAQPAPQAQPVFGRTTVSNGNTGFIQPFPSNGAVIPLNATGAAATGGRLPVNRGFVQPFPANGAIIPLRTTGVTAAHAVR